MRLDIFLVQHNFFTSREKAQRAIEAGAVFVDGVRARKASQKVADGAHISIEQVKIEHYVSRAAYKLLGAFEAWESLSVDGKVALDIGASTGGFTQVLLERGARRVYAVDVGTGQLVDDVRQDSRVVCLEQTDARTLTKEVIPEAIEFFVSDVSFISIFKILPSIMPLFAPGAQGVILYKPQFELGRAYIGARGVVTDVSAIEHGLARAQEQCKSLGLQVRGEPIASPLKGKTGNQEYLIFVQA